MANICYLEDDPSLRAITAVVLQRGKHQVSCAAESDGLRNILDTYRQENKKIDIYLSDTDLGEAGWGDEVYRQALEEYPDVLEDSQVIALSGNDEYLKRWNGVAAKMMKPVRPKELYEIINKCLDKEHKA